MEGRGPRNQAQKEMGPDPGKSLPPFGEDFHCPLSFEKSLRGSQQQGIVRVVIQRLILLMSEEWFREKQIRRGKQVYCCNLSKK